MPLRRPGPEGARACARLTSWTSSGKRVLVRVDFNVPLDDDRRITDDSRIRAALPTLKELREKRARLLLAAHLGRPKGRDEKFSLRPAADRLAELLGEEVVLADVARRRPRRRRRDARERALRARRDEERSRAGGALRRAGRRVRERRVRRRAPGARVDGGRRPPAAERGRTAAGARGEHAPGHPPGSAAAARGRRRRRQGDGQDRGARRVPADRADRVLVGGAMCFPFFKAQGHEVGDSLCEDEGLEPARRVLGAGGEKLRLPATWSPGASSPPTRRRRRSTASTCPAAGWGSTSAAAARTATPR